MQKMDDIKGNYFNLKKIKIKIIIFKLLIFVFFLATPIHIFQRYNYKEKLKDIYRTNEEPMNAIQTENIKISKCL